MFYQIALSVFLLTYVTGCKTNATNGDGKLTDLAKDGNAQSYTISDDEKFIIQTCKVIEGGCLAKEIKFDTSYVNSKLVSTRSNAEKPELLRQQANAQNTLKQTIEALQPIQAKLADFKTRRKSFEGKNDEDSKAQLKFLDNEISSLEREEASKGRTKAAAEKELADINAKLAELNPSVPPINAYKPYLKKGLVYDGAATADLMAKFMQLKDVFKEISSQGYIWRIPEDYDVGYKNETTIYFVGGRDHQKQYHCGFMVHSYDRNGYPRASVDNKSCAVSEGSLKIYVGYGAVYLRHADKDHDYRRD